MQFTLPGSEAPVQARGRVVRVQQETEDDPAGMGIEFDTLDGSAQESIDALVRELRAQGGD